MVPAIDQEVIPYYSEISPVRADKTTDRKVIRGVLRIALYSLQFIEDLIKQR